MGLFQNIIRGAEEGIRALREPVGLPGVEARGTEAAPKLLTDALAQGSPITQRAPNVPFLGEPATQPTVRATLSPPVNDPIGTLKTLAKGFVDRDPEVTTSVLRSNDLSEKLYEGAWRHEAAPTIADRDVASWFAPLQRDPVPQAQLVHDYMITLDEVAQAQRRGADNIKGIPLPVWQASADRLQSAVEADPEVAATVRNVRDNLDGMFQDMAQRGWIDPKRYLDDYTPIRRINAMLDGLAHFTGEDPQGLRSRILSAQQKRGTSTAVRETDLLDLLRRHRAEYLSKIAMHEAFLDIISDPTVNFTEQFYGKADLPKGLAVYRPGAGMFGSTAKTTEGYLFDSHLRAIDSKGKLAAGGYVLPEKLVSALNEFNKRNLSGTESQWAKAQGALARWLTVYNPANTQVNRASDLLVAMFFPEQGQAHPLGVLRWMGKATAASYDSAFRGKPNYVTLHGRTVDLGDLAVREGLTTGTIQHDVGGERMPSELLHLSPEAQALHDKWFGNIFKTMEADRLATEMAPRIAAGLEAVERTGDWSQFGKVGRDITFRYGAGAPRVSKLPILKAMAPFLQFQGLATQRMLHTWGAKGMEPKVRLALGLVAVPLAIHAWNTQNDNYKQAELALPEYERNQMHIWMPDGNDPSKPRLDVDGKPVALRFRLWVPDQVAQNIGLGNAAPRMKRVLEGRDTPMQFLQQSAKMSSESISSNLVIPSIVSTLLTGKTPQGTEAKGFDRVERVIPMARIAGDTYRATKNYGLTQGTLKFLGDITGMRPANVKHRGTGLLDAQVEEAKKAVRDAQAQVNAYKLTDPDKLDQALHDLVSAKKELARLAKQLAKEKAAGYNRPAPRNEPIPSVGATRSVIDRVLKEVHDGQAGS